MICTYVNILKMCEYFTDICNRVLSIYIKCIIQYTYCGTNIRLFEAYCTWIIANTVLFKGQSHDIFYPGLNHTRRRDNCEKNTEVINSLRDFPSRENCFANVDLYEIVGEVEGEKLGLGGQHQGAQHVWNRAGHSPHTWGHEYVE